MCYNLTSQKNLSKKGGPMQYYLIIKDMSNKFNYRFRIVEYAFKYGKSRAAREYKTTRKTIRKWVGRFKQEGLKGLEDRKKTPEYIPHKLRPEEEKRIIELRQKHPSWGSRRLIERYHVKGSHSAVNRVMR